MRRHSSHGNKWLTAMLAEAAGSVGRMKSANYLSAQHARLTSRRGMARAQVAVAYSILVSAYWMLTRDEPSRTSVRSGWPAATTRPMPVGWLPSSNASATPWSSTRSRSSTAEELGRAARAPR
jgi:hypothetical protein